MVHFKSRDVNVVRADTGDLEGRTLPLPRFAVVGRKL
jgi:hypothetical protein